MRSCIWFISRHSLWKNQSEGIKNTLGDKTTIKKKHIRFASIEEFTKFIRRANKIGAKPFFIDALPDTFFEEAVRLKLSFGTFVKPTRDNGVTTFVINWFTQGQAKEIFRLSVRKSSNKGYRNRSSTAH